MIAAKVTFVRIVWGTKLKRSKASLTRSVHNPHCFRRQWITDVALKATLHHTVTVWAVDDDYTVDVKRSVIALERLYKFN